MILHDYPPRHLTLGGGSIIGPFIRDRILFYVSRASLVTFFFSWIEGVRGAKTAFEPCPGLALNLTRRRSDFRIIPDVADLRSPGPSFRAKHPITSTMDTIFPFAKRALAHVLPNPVAFGGACQSWVSSPPAIQAIETNTGTQCQICQRHIFRPFHTLWRLQPCTSVYQFSDILRYSATQGSNAPRGGSSSQV